MIEAGSTENIDRSLLWKRAMQKKDGSYDDVVLPVVEKIVSRHFVPKNHIFKHLIWFYLFES